MKSIHSQYRVPNSSLLGWTLAIVALTFGLAATASATVPLYQNSSVLNYTVPGTPPPTIDAMAFDNENQFNVSYLQAFFNPLFYEPMNTVNYTNRSSGINTGIMTVNSPFTDVNSFFFIANEVGAGFQFDTLTTNTIPHREAGTFFNSGQIRADSVIDGNNVINFDGNEFFDFFDIGQVRVWATNIFCPGNIDVGENGFIQLTGDNLDLSHSVLTLEQGLNTSNNVDANIISEGEGFEVNSNGVWDPFAALTPALAYSAPPDNLVLRFPQSFIQINQTGPTNVIVRAVFLENVNTNTPASVYITPPVFGNEGALIQWYGTYLDPSTGIVNTNYLYLFHYFFNSTNQPPILTVGAIPNQFDAGLFNNWLWAQTSPFPGLPTPNVALFQNIFNNTVYTNVLYEYFNSTLSGTTVSTNAGTANPSGALTNLPARIQIIANKDLKLALAQISGQNYLSITATNQFDGSPGALITSPFTDLNLGVTNGYPFPLTVSNLLSSGPIPQWGGTLNEWSTRWTNFDATSGIISDYRVMLVYADLIPALTPFVQNLTLNASNVVISDTLNIFGATYANAESLTLTTNVFGEGALSPEGELDMQLQNPFTWSWSGSFPNLLWLTNCGAIRSPNFSDIESSSFVTNITPAVPPIQAAATLAETGPSNNIAAGGTVTVLSTSYVFVKTLTQSTPWQVKVGANFNGSMSNLIAAINRGPGSGINYSTNTFASTVVNAGLLNVTNGSVVFSAGPDYPGSLGNGIPVSTTVTNLAWNSTVLIGGVDGIPGTTNISTVSVPYGAIVNNGYLSDLGASIWVTNFMNGGAISNGPGSFQLNSITTTMTNGSILAGGDISFTANTFVASNIILQAGRSLVLQVTNYLWDGGASNANLWAVGATNGTGGPGLILPFLPTNTTPGLNNLLGSGISIVAPPPNKQVATTWAGLDYGASTIGYNTNNVAIGQLVLNCTAASSSFYFSGPVGSVNNNAIYVDQLILENYASLADLQGSAGIPTLQFNSNPGAGNLTIYYADAMATEFVNGGPLQDVSYLLNGLNNGHLVWVPQYVGIYSGTNIVYSNGSLNRLNSGLVAIPDISSAGNGIANADSPDPIFVGSQINLRQFSVDNCRSNELVWDSPPGATNFVLCSTNEFGNWNVAAIVTNSPTAPPPGGWPITNIVYLPTMMGPNCTTNSHCWYRIKINQDNSILYGQ